MEIPHIQERLMTLPHEIQKAGEVYAKDKAEMEFQDDWKKVVMSEKMFALSKQFKEQKVTASEWKLRFIAECSPEYKKALETLKIAREKALTSQARYNSLQTEFEAVRSLSALEKAMTRNL